ncbi:LOW QUALITY PROTEIN: regulation of nuclear pre-mRNA domain-containing protein 2 [Rana temporaria]|uniref:LOW QUALITY PROTEIN: regulation of nuclear pre-mRNA domain-containing protein 2 n=1 Tax=Rana temporaria TaxID=8407 RepID=UPI001AACCD65|nr:LOW QUALITY PROTEIN: regulation of nuclear pre-mRNA domain-containing protein 2 [Rana temporaria]
MAAGSSSKASVGALEAALDRKLQGVSNTMESIQNLSTWCIENKKQHSIIVHYWLKWFRRSGFPHRLNLFYLANDIIQNCKRRNAIVYRQSFAEVLPEAVSLVRDPSVVKSVERVIKIWEERSVYPADTIGSFKSSISGGWSKRERERSKSSRPRPEKPPPEPPVVVNKAELKSKIVAEFRPQGLIDDVLAYKRGVDHIDFKEKQLSSMRVDVCSTETLKRLKDKAGGKKFSKDFEEASSKLEEFVNLLDKQVKNGPSITEALENAGIFYEAQYREVKVVVNAYKTFANRVNNLKKKLDQLKATLPDPEESPVPSPVLDAPSPTGSESPFQGMEGEASPLSPEVEPIPSESPEPPKDNRIVEDMELSDEDADDDIAAIILEERSEQVEPPTSSLKDTTIGSDSPEAPENTTPPPVPAPVSLLLPPQSALRDLLPPSAISSTTTSPVTSTPSKSVTTPTIPPSVPLALPNLANVDLGKISSILSSLTSAMKSGVSPAGKPSPGTPTTPNTNLAGGLKTSVQTTPNSLANILSKVEFTPESILSVLSKTQVPAASNLQGLSSLIQSVAASTALSSGSATLSTSTAPMNTTLQSVKDRVTPSVTPPFVSKNFGYSPTDPNPDTSLTPASKPPAPPSSSVTQAVSTVGFSSQTPVSAEKTNSQPPEIPKQAEETEPSSLEMKIHNFLKGNPGFSGLDLNIPILSGLGSSAVPETSSEFQSGPTSTSLDNIDGTPVRDERSGTPTQDEIMDKPPSSNVDSVSLLSKIISSGSSTPSNTMSPLLNKDSDYQKLPPMPAYRPFGIGGSSPNAYRQSSDIMEKPSIVDSTLDTFYPDTSFNEDEDYRAFDFTGPSPSTIGNLESKSILQSNMHLNSMEYPPVTQSYSQVPDYSMQPFPPSVQPPFISGENSGKLSPPPDRYGGYNIRGNLESTSSPSPLKDDSLYPSDTNHNIPLLHPSMPQNRHSDFLPKNNLPSVRPPIASTEQSGPSVAVSTTIEFKNMLKNASRRPCEEGPFGQSSLDEDIRISGLGHVGRSSDVQSEEQYRIETRVSSSSLDLSDSTEEKGAPIETLGYHNMGNRRMSGEPIKTVESMRVGMKGGRGHGMEGGRGDWFDMGNNEGTFDGTQNADAQPSVSGNVGFKPQYDEHLTRFPDSVSDFRANNIQPFEHRLPPPPMALPLDRGGPFQMDQTGPPPGPPPVLPPDPGSLFGRDMPVAPQMPPMEPPQTLPHVAHPPSDHANNPFPLHHTAEHGGMQFSPPPRLDMRNPFSQDHGAVHQGMMQEPYSMHSSSGRDQGPMSHDYSGQHSQPHGRVNEPMGHHPRDHHGNFPGSQQPHFSSHHRDFMNTGGPRPQRPHFRPREPFHNLKRPRPPFGRGQQFFSPKRPYYPPRY